MYVHRILAIPLPNYDMVEFVVWGMTKKIRLSVKSSYYVEWDHIFGGNLCQPNGQETMQVGSVWQLIWSLDCPTKVKIFLWRTLHGTMPRNVVLENHHIPVRPACPACGQSAEDVLHVLFRCKKARKCGAS